MKATWQHFAGGIMSATSQCLARQQLLVSVKREDSDLDFLVTFEANLSASQIANAFFDLKLGRL